MERSATCRPKPETSSLVFGKQFSDHMLTVNWSEESGWEAPQIKPFQNLSLHPASSALHYSIEVRPRPHARTHSRGDEATAAVLCPWLCPCSCSRA